MFRPRRVSFARVVPRQKPFGNDGFVVMVGQVDELRIKRMLAYSLTKELFQPFNSVEFMLMRAHEVRLDGTVVTEVPGAMAVVFQDYGRSLFAWMRVRDNVALPLRHLGLSAAERQARVQAALGEVGLVRRIEPAGSPARYELRGGDNHHHLVCTECGRLEDVPCTVGHAPCLTPAEDHDFEIEVAEVVFRGRCSRCRETLAAIAIATATAP